MAEFLVSTCHSIWASSSPLTAEKRNIGPLAALSVLKTQMFIVEEEAPRTGKTSMRSLASLAEQTVNKIFNTAFPKLAALVIRVSVLHSETAEDEIFAFFRSEHVEMDGERMFVAVKIEPHMVKHNVACADVLDEEEFVFT